jgi:hypothetical protein
MRWTVFLVPVVLWAARADARGAPLYDPGSVNIGLNCQWQKSCIADQEKAMKRSLKFVRKNQPPEWRVHMCNKNASRKRFRMDWVGFHNCIRNANLRPAPPPPRATKKRARPLTENNPPPSYSKGERGH